MCNSHINDNNTIYILCIHRTFYNIWESKLPMFCIPMHREIMRLLLVLLLILPIGMVNAQDSYCPPESEAVCFGGDMYLISLYSEVQIFFDTSDPSKLTECTVVCDDNTYVVPVTVLKIKEKKYIYKVIARLDHSKLDMMNKFVFLFPKY